MTAPGNDNEPDQDGFKPHQNKLSIAMLAFMAGTMLFAAVYLLIRWIAS